MVALLLEIEATCPLNHGKKDMGFEGVCHGVHLVTAYKLLK